MLAGRPTIAVGARHMRRYDSRMWHRQCHELNVSGTDRIAILNAVAPAWVLPMMDKAKEFELLCDAQSVVEQLTERERRDLNAMCASRVGGRLITTRHQGAKARL